MTKKLLGLTALSLSLITGAVAQPISVPGASQAAPKQSAPAAEQKQQKLIRVCTLNSVEANQQFQANVQLVQTQRQQAIQLKAALEKETDAAQKKDLQAKLDELMARLNENNQKMAKTYGFTLERNYAIVNEVTHVYMFVTDEEAAKYEKEQAAAAEKEKAAAKDKAPAPAKK